MGELVTISEAARRLGCHRQQLQRCIRDGRLGPPWLVCSSGSPRLRIDGLDAVVRGIIRPRVDRQPEAPAGPSQPASLPPAGPPAADPEVAALRDQVAALQERERAWLAAHQDLREWLIAETAIDLMRALPDPAPIGSVMVETRRLLIDRLVPLDAIATASRWPR